MTFELARIYLFTFGVLTIAGGILGFVKAKSRASLIAGSVAGLLLLVAGHLVGTSGRNGLFLGLAVSLSLTSRFGAAYFRSRKLMPAGLMTILGIIGVVLTALGLFEH
jgi:uncharacterized membrane protein (UPF0136 family)